MNAGATHLDEDTLDGSRSDHAAPSSLLFERDALVTRVLILEAALACIERETEITQTVPELSFFAVQRIASVARQSLARVDPIEPRSASTLRGIARTRS